MEQANQWEWGSEGVAIERGSLLWNEKEGAIRSASNSACEQSFADFLGRGPRVDGVPADVREKVTVAVRELLAKSL